MEDFQRGWYWQLLIESVRSERPGYLKLDANLWTIAGAKRRDFFESHKSAVLACFKVRQVAGSSWIYNERLVRTLEEQAEKVNKKRRRDDALPSYSVSDFEEKNTNNEGEVCLETPDLPASALARGMCEALEMAATLGNLRSIAAAIEIVAKRPDYTLPKAYEEIKWKAIEAKSNGELINKFWFEDSRWSGQINGKPSKQSETDEAIRRAVRAVAGTAD